MNKTITPYVMQIDSQLKFEPPVNTKACQKSRIHGSRNPFTCKQFIYKAKLVEFCS